MTDELQTNDIQLFRSLGFEFKANKPGNSDLADPDYLLFTPGDPVKPIAAALTYVWNRNLDDQDQQRHPDTPGEIPGATVVSVLAKAQAGLTRRGGMRSCRMR